MHLVLSVCQESPRCFKEGVCGGDGVCSLPGRRAGHASSSFFYQGGPSVLILYGGEIHKNETSTERQLTNDIVTGWFDGSSITWARMNLDCPQSWSCPEPRRDMSISIIDSRGDSRLRICVCVLKIYKFQSVRVCKRQNLESNDHGQLRAQNAVACMWDDDTCAVPNRNRWFPGNRAFQKPDVSVRPSDPLMFENLCSGKLIVFGGLSGGLIEDYLEERGAKTECFSNQFRNKCEDLSLTLLPCQTVIQCTKNEESLQAQAPTH